MGNLAAGAIGSLITLVVAFAARLTAIPREVRSHDRRVRERDTSLASWVGDRDVWLRRELRQTRNELAKDNLLDSGEYAYQVGLTKERALHEWRDEARQAQSEVDAIYEDEGVLHSVWRRLASARLSLQTPANAEPVLNAWRSPPTTPGDRQRGTTAGPIDDPTARMLSHVVKGVAERWADYQ
jgi:hypothetical protein